MTTPKARLLVEQLVDLGNRLILLTSEFSSGLERPMCCHAPRLDGAVPTGSSPPALQHQTPNFKPVGSHAGTDKPPTTRGRAHYRRQLSARQAAL